MHSIQQTPSGIKSRLFIMMVLQIAVWGAWLPLIFGYLPSLGFNASEQAWILNAFAISAIIGMFFSNDFADRRFAAEKFMAFSHLIGGAAMIALFFIKAPAGMTVEQLDLAAKAKDGIGTSPIFWPFFGLMLVHCLFYVPTLSISNAIAFTHMQDAKRDFPIVRMGGTVGWILISWPFIFILVDWTKVGSFGDLGLVNWFGAVFSNGLTGPAAQASARATLVVSGIISLALAAFSLTLPHTPPKPAKEGAGFAWAESLALLAKPAIFVLFVVTLMDAVVHNVFFVWTGQFLGTAMDKGGAGIPGNWVMPVMTIGQVAEIGTMLILAAVLQKLGWRWTMVIGVLGHVARFGVFAFFPESQGLVIAVQVLHGICYAFFFATLYIFIDEYLPQHIRASTQGLFNMLVFGFGPFIANYFGPMMRDEKTTGIGESAVVAWKSLFIIPCGIGLAAALLLAFAFHPPKETPKLTGGGVAPH
jgi:predicted MFS family arabinose efflux permease